MDRKALADKLRDTETLYLPDSELAKLLREASDALRPDSCGEAVRALTFSEFRQANKARCIKWHPAGIASWSPSDWLTAVTGELGELASLLKMRNRERDGLVGNKFSPTDKQIADEIADVFTYLDLLAEALGVDLGKAVADKFNEISQRNGFPDRINALPTLPAASGWVPEEHVKQVRKALEFLHAHLERMDAKMDHGIMTTIRMDECDRIEEILRTLPAPPAAEIKGER